MWWWTHRSDHAARRSSTPIPTPLNLSPAAITPLLILHHLAPTPHPLNVCPAALDLDQDLPTTTPPSALPAPPTPAPVVTMHLTAPQPLVVCPTDPGVRLPGLGKGQTFHRNIPSVGHKRLVFVTPSAHTHTRSRPSVIMGEMDRIYHRVRPSLAYQPTEDYLNSRSMVSFDDETRSIRAKTADILRRIHTPVPRAQRPLPLPGDADVMELPADWHDSFDWYPEELGQTRLRLKLLSLKRDLAELNTGAYYSHSELPLTERITSDNYIDRLLSGTRNVARDINVMSHYEDPAKHYSTIGRGHLACVSFAGGRPISKRRNLASDDPVKDDINVLSHYGRFRAAAAASVIPPTEPEYNPPTHRAPTKSAVTGSWKSNAPRVPKEAKNENLTAGEAFDAAQDRKQRRRDAVEAAAQREVDEEKRRKQETSRQDELAQQALIDREKELERKAREAEEAAIQKAEDDRLEAERLAKEEEERLLKEEEDRLAAEELKLIEEEEARKRQEEEEKKAKKAKKEADKKAKEEAERKAKEEADRLAAEEAAKAKEEAEQKAREEEERLRKEEEERKAKEEEEQRAREEAERQAKEEAERQAKEEADRLAAEEAAAAEQVTEPAAEETPEAVEAPVEEVSEEAVQETKTEEQAVPESAGEAEATEEPIVEEAAETEDPAEEVLSEEADE